MKMYADAEEKQNKNSKRRYAKAMRQRISRQDNDDHKVQSRIGLRIGDQGRFKNSRPLYTRPNINNNNSVNVTDLRMKLKGRRRN